MGMAASPPTSEIPHTSEIPQASEMIIPRRRAL